MNISGQARKEVQINNNLLLYAAFRKHFKWHGNINMPTIQGDLFQTFAKTKSKENRRVPFPFTLPLSAIYNLPLLRHPVFVFLMPARNIWSMLQIVITKPNSLRPPPSLYNFFRCPWVSTRLLFAAARALYSTLSMSTRTFQQPNIFCMFVCVCFPNGIRTLFSAN